MTRRAPPYGRLALSGSAYSRRALAAAAQILRRQGATFAVKTTARGDFAVTARALPPDLPREQAWGRFLSEALSQECRQDLRARNSAIPKPMMLQSVMSALGAAATPHAAAH